MESNVTKKTRCDQSCSVDIALDNLSIQQLLENYWRNSVLMRFFANNFLPEKIPLSRLKNQTVIYRCAIAFALASRQGISPFEVAKQLMGELATVAIPPHKHPKLTFTVSLTAPGWIDFHLSDAALRLWLDHIPRLHSSIAFLGNREGEIDNRQNKIVKSEDLTPLQYVHARCCSLLRLGHQEGLIELWEPNLQAFRWQWKQPDPIPWLTQTEPERLILTQTPEKQLIHEFLSVLEALESPAAISWSKLAINLGYAVLDFERHCRIWGEVQQNNLSLVQARLGLMAIAQYLLRELLENRLNLSVVLEL